MKPTRDKNRSYPSQLAPNVDFCEDTYKSGQQEEEDDSDDKQVDEAAQHLNVFSMMKSISGETIMVNGRTV